MSTGVHQMLASQTVILTQSGSRYLQQICKHWSHKFAVEFTPETGRSPFDDGRVCLREADDAALRLRVEAADDEALARAERVVIEHLKRFAFREDLGDTGLAQPIDRFDKLSLPLSQIER